MVGLDDEDVDLFSQTLLARVPLSEGENCLGCGDAVEEMVRRVSPGALRLHIEWEETYITLCPEHERELLTLLLSNYVRRLRRGKAQFTIPKLKEAKECQTTPTQA